MTRKKGEDIQEELKKLEDNLKLKYATTNDKNNWIGKIFESNKCGSFIVIDVIKKNKDGSTNYLCKFINTGYLVNIHKSNIKTGSVTDRYYPIVYNVGIIGDIGSISVNKYPYYGLWRYMLHRSYNEEYKNKYPTYKDVIVCDEWLTLTNFSKDVSNIIGYKQMIEHGYKYKFNLDKDIILHNNKIYNLNNCCLIPEKLNSFFINKQITNTTGYEGVGLHNGKIRARVNRDNKSIFIGHFSDPLDAYNEYHKNKKEILDYYLNNEFNFIDNFIKEKMYIKLQNQYDETLNKEKCL